jgi:hypothetical protein
MQSASCRRPNLQQAEVQVRPTCLFAGGQSSMRLGCSARLLFARWLHAHAPHRRRDCDWHAFASRLLPRRAEDEGGGRIERERHRLGCFVRLRHRAHVQRLVYMICSANAGVGAATLSV